MGSSTLGHAQSVAESPAISPSEEGMPEIDGGCYEAVLFGGTDGERSAYCELQKRHYASARTLAQQVVRANPDSFRGLYVLGMVQHRGEANLPKALRMLNGAEKVYTEKYGFQLEDLEPVPKALGYRLLFEIMDVHGEMDHHEERIAAAEALTLRLGIDHGASKAWPLMKLGRFQEARKVVKQALASEDPWNRSVARTSLCAIESELRRRQEAYEACRLAAEMARDRRNGGAVELTNAGAAAEEIFLFGEAERLYLEATKRSPETSVNPWGRLVHVYLAQGRFLEAMGAWRSMRRYRSQRAYTYLNQQDEAEAQLVGAAVLLVAGRSDLAEPVLRAIVDRPDRQGTSSASSEQNEAGAALVARVARLSLARRKENEAVLAPVWERLKLNASALRLRWDAWFIGRRAARILANPERLVATLRPEVPGSLELPSWLDAEVIEVVGPGISEVALAEARRTETLDDELVQPVFDAYESEIAWRKGDYARAFLLGMRSLDAGQRGLQMVVSRAGVIAGDAAARLGNYDDALTAFREVLARDPVAFIRLGVPLPVKWVPVAGDSIARDVVAALRWAPMFVERAWGFRLKVHSDGAQLLDHQGNSLSTIRVYANDEPKDQPVRQLAWAIQQRLSTPKLDITQLDISSLEGGVGGNYQLSDQLDLSEEQATPTQ
ncbi:MAG: tetratricopeptide repeat protein [Myxococcales bacterium]|nr:tetratricopeptide repeat protein [Myxococcales bacterium]